MDGAQVVVEALKREGVKYIFGYPGGACMPIFDALLDAPELELVLVRHEQGGTHMAAKATHPRRTKAGKPTWPRLDVVAAHAAPDPTPRCALEILAAAATAPAS